MWKPAVAAAPKARKLRRDSESLGLLFKGLDGRLMQLKEAVLPRIVFPALSTTEVPTRLLADAPNPIVSASLSAFARCSSDFSRGYG
jgi:hypothetical protein